VDGAKTLMITSSVSGEGKTFCSINIATVLHLVEKKTVIIGCDLKANYLMSLICLMKWDRQLFNQAKKPR
jgi:Mrp family chromosome partitioning ATPase